MSQQALARVTDFWLQALPYLIRLPLSDAQRRFVLRWQPADKSKTAPHKLLI
jgi:hypothetical protein